MGIQITDQTSKSHLDTVTLNRGLIPGDAGAGSIRNKEMTIG
jgi:hypothetical protein